jgi:hypothetical protein
LVYEGDSSVDFLLYEPLFVGDDVNYTIALWANPTTDTGRFCESESVVNELVFHYDTGVLKVAHGGTNISMVIDVDVQVGEWHHYGVTYNSDLGTINVYVDGENVVTAAAPNHASFTGLRLFHGHEGRADSFRFYRKEQPSEFMRELYQKERR